MLTIIFMKPRERVRTKCIPRERNEEMAAKILVVDDHDGVRELLKAHLGDLWGYEVFTYPDGLSATKFLEEESPDLDAIILDVMMRTHGGTVAQQIKKDPKYKNVLLIFYSGLSKSHIDSKILEGGHFIQKSEHSLKEITTLLQKKLEQKEE